MNSIAGCRKVEKFSILFKSATSQRFYSSVLSTSSPHTLRSESEINDIKKEVEQHAKQASQWWERLGGLKPLHSLNELRVPFIRDGILANNVNNISKIDKSKILEGFKILDVGCGGGILTESLANLHASVTGIDLGEELICIAQDHSKILNKNIQKHLTYKVQSVEDHARENQSKYDAVVLSEVIEHIENKIDFLTNCLQALKSGGSIFITTPNKTLISWIFIINLAENLNAIPKGTHHYDKFISPLDMQRILDSMDCNTIFINGMFYNFLNNEWIWTSNRDFCYALQAIKA